jgi:hypothetical protein
MARAEVNVREFWLYSILYLLLSMLFSIIVGEYSYDIGVKILEEYPMMKVAYSGMKIVLGIAYLMFLERPWIEILFVIAFTLLIRFFAEGTFTIALIGAMMGMRFVKGNPND